MQNNKMEDLRTYATLVIPAAGRSSRFKRSSDIDKCLAPVINHLDVRGNRRYLPLIVNTLCEIRSRNRLIAKSNDKDIFIKDVFIIVNSNNYQKIKDTIEYYKDPYIEPSERLLAGDNDSHFNIHYFIVDNYDGDAAALYRLFTTKEFVPFGYVPTIVMWSDTYIADHLLKDNSYLKNFSLFLKQSQECIERYNTVCSVAAEICNYKDGVPYCIIKEWPEERSANKRGTISRIYGIDHASNRTNFAALDYEKYLNKRTWFFRKNNYLLHDLSVFYINVPLFLTWVIDWINFNGIQKDPSTGTFDYSVKFMDILNFKSGQDNNSLLFNSLNGKFTRSFNTMDEYKELDRKNVDDYADYVTGYGFY